MIISFDRFRVQDVLSRMHGPEGVKFNRNPLDRHALRMGLRLMGREGVYVVPDAPEAVLDSRYWVFAYEANPKVMEEEAWRLSVERVFGTVEGGEELLSPEVVNQWMCRSLLTAIRLDVTPLSIRLIYDYDIDFNTDHLFFHDGIVEKESD